MDHKSIAKNIKAIREANGHSLQATADLLEIHVAFKGFALCVNMKDFFSALDIGIANGHLSVKTSGTEKRGVKDVGAVRCRHDDDALMRAEAVHFNKKLVESLLSLVVTAAKACASVASDGVDLVDEDDRSGRFAGGFKQIAHTRSTDTDVHLHEIRARDRVERNTCLARNSLCKQGLTRAGRAHQQNAVGYLCAESGEFFGILEEFNDFLELFLFLICTRNVLEKDLLLKGLNIIYKKNKR